MTSIVSKKTLQTCPYATAHLFSKRTRRHNLIILSQRVRALLFYSLTVLITTSSAMVAFTKELDRAIDPGLIQHLREQSKLSLPLTVKQNLPEEMPGYTSGLYAQKTTVRFQLSPFKNSESKNHKTKLFQTSIYGKSEHSKKKLEHRLFVQPHIRDPDSFQLKLPQNSAELGVQQMHRRLGVDSRIPINSLPRNIRDILANGPFSNEYGVPLFPWLTAIAVNHALGALYEEENVLPDYISSSRGSQSRSIAFALIRSVIETMLQEDRSIDEIARYLHAMWARDQLHMHDPKMRTEQFSKSLLAGIFPQTVVDSDQITLGMRMLGYQLHEAYIGPQPHVLEQLKAEHFFGTQQYDIVARLLSLQHSTQEENRIRFPNMLYFEMVYRRADIE